MFYAYKRIMLASLLIGLGWSPVYAQDSLFEISNPLNTNAEQDSSQSFDSNAHLDTDGNGNWVAVWNARLYREDLEKMDMDILAATSTDDGNTWTEPTAVNSYASQETHPYSHDNDPRIATNGKGTWVATWKSLYNLKDPEKPKWQIYTARSTDNGATWEPAAMLTQYADGDAESNTDPWIASGGGDTWITVWEAKRNKFMGKSVALIGYMSISIDDGQTWSAPNPVGMPFNADYPINKQFNVASDQKGTWIITWAANESDSEPSSKGRRIVFIRSTDNGKTWSHRSSLNSAPLTLQSMAVKPQVQSNRHGAWMIIWQCAVNPKTGDKDRYNLVASLSTDNGESWGEPYVVNSPQHTLRSMTGWHTYCLGADKKGGWHVAWETRLNPETNPNDEVLCVRSANAEVTQWSEPVLIREAYNDKEALDMNPWIGFDQAGRLLATWVHRTGGTANMGGETDVYFTKSKAAFIK